MTDRIRVQADRVDPVIVVASTVTRATSGWTARTPTVRTAAPNA